MSDQEIQGRESYEERLFEAILEQAFNSVVITNGSFENNGPLIQRCNPAFCRMTGYPEHELIGRSPRILQGAETDPGVIDELRQCLADGRFFQGSTVNYRKDGTPYHVEWNISPIRDRHGEIRHYVSIQQDITARVRAESERDLLARALNLAKDPILITDAQARIIFANHALEQLTGYSFDDIFGKTPRFLQSGEQDSDFYAQLRQALQRGEAFRATFANLNQAGETYYVDQTITPLIDETGTVQHFISIGKDVTEAVGHQQQLSQEASRDGLTGLLNRRAGERALANAHHRGQAEQRPFALLFADIDHFKQINDRFGHDTGDLILKRVAEVIERQSRSSDQAVRWGGEEFVLILDQATETDAQATAERIRAAVETAAVDPRVDRMTLSLGCAQWQPGETPAELLRRVDQALYAAKSGGRNQVVVAEKPGD